MKITFSLALWLSLFLMSCSMARRPTHVFYLHGKIVEEQGVNAYSETFGPYLYQDIIDSLSGDGIVMHNEVRTTKTDFYAFGQKISRQIDSLIREGFKPERITVVGASKGAVLAMYVSHLNTQPINYVLLGANNDYVEKENDWTLHGRILGIYEASDALAGKNYQHWIAKSKATAQYVELQLHTGLGHGFLYRPLPEWLGPARAWMDDGK